MYSARGGFGLAKNNAISGRELVQDSVQTNSCKLLVTNRFYICFFFLDLNFKGKQIAIYGAIYDSIYKDI